MRLATTMCAGIALAWSELPTELIAHHGLWLRLHNRGGEPEVRFLYRDPDPVLPVWHQGRLTIVRWGNARGHSRFLPRTGWTWMDTLEQGGWQSCEPIRVDIPATLGLEKGVWFRVRQGLRAILVRDERQRPVVYLLCEPATHYYQVMTRSNRMPVLCEEQI
jgi:hypothetical protein